MAPALGRPRRADVVRVLLVDPLPGPRSAVLRTLLEAGFDVVQVADGKEALAIHASADPPADVVVADAMPAGMTAAELAVRLRAVDPHLAVVLFSSFPPNLIRAPDGVRVVSSDATPEELLSAVAAALPGSA